MDLRQIARWAGLVGGLLWLGRWGLHIAGKSGATLDLLHLAGLVLLAAALAGTGAALVSTSAKWLQAIVAVAYPILVWSVLEVLHPAASAESVDGLFGLVVVGLFGMQLVKDRSAEPGPEKVSATKPGARRAGRDKPNGRSSGSHAR